MTELPESAISPTILAAFEAIEQGGIPAALYEPGYFCIEGRTIQPLVIPFEKPKAATKPKKPVYPTQDGLLLLPAEPIEEWGDCPGGRYHFITRVIDAIELLNQWSAEELWAAIDLETSAAYRWKTDPNTGEQVRWHPDKVIDPHISTIFLCSISVCPGEAYVFDIRALMQDEEFVESFRRFITTCGLVAQNSFFEQSFFMAQFGVRAKIEYDTLIVSQILNAGRKISNGLGALYRRHLGIEADKSWQHGFLDLHETSPLPNAAIAYSAGDVCQLLTLAQILHEKLKASGMLHIWEEIEKPLLPWMAEAKVHGIELDRSVLEQMRAELVEKIQERQLELETLMPGVLVSSHSQLLDWFNANGWCISSTDEKKVLEPNLKQDPDSLAGRAAHLLLDYREVQKLLGTYVEPMLSVHPSLKDGRIHPDWKQNSTDTGRMAVASPTVQNWPSKGPYTWIRNALVAEPGHVLVYIDYSQYEVRSLADQANEISMIRAFEEALQAGQQLRQQLTELHLPENVIDLREKEPERFSEIIAQHSDVGQLIERLDECDFHRQTASALFKKPAAEITKQERSLAKTALFAVIYGAGPKGLAEQTKTTKEEAQDLITNFYVRFPCVDKFMTRVRKKALNIGWTASPAGRRRFYPQPDHQELYKLYRAQKEEHDRIWAEFHASVPDNEEARDGLSVEDWLKKQKIKKPKKTDWEKSSASSRSKDPLDMATRQVKMQLAGIERESGNQVIQTSNADATKLATVLAAPRLRELHSECTILMWVHDEIVLTAPEPVVDQAAVILESAMIEAAKRHLTRTPVECSVSTGKCWSK